MNTSEFDKCPQCGSHPQMGLRCHPKFSVKAGIMAIDEDGRRTPDLVAYYAHDLPSFKALVEALRAAPNVEVLECEQWKERDDRDQSHSFGGKFWWTEIFL